jgi:hypothetical protein
MTFFGACGKDCSEPVPFLLDALNAFPAEKNEHDLLPIARRLCRAAPPQASISLPAAECSTRAPMQSPQIFGSNRQFQNQYQ